MPFMISLRYFLFSFRDLWILSHLYYYMAFEFPKFLCNFFENLEQVMQVKIDVPPIELLACG